MQSFCDFFADFCKVFAGRFAGSKVQGAASVPPSSEAPQACPLLFRETSIKCIIRKKFEYIRDKYKDINIDINDNVTDEIVDKCEFYEFGARRIDKIISKDIENVIIDGVIRGDKDIYIDSIVKKNITS